MPKINPEPNVFDDNLLDVVGQEFRFDHAKGLAEWLKNSADAYTREDVPDDEQVILIDILERQPKKKSTFKVVDFVGMTHDDIVEAFKRWGDPRAATRAPENARLAVTVTVESSTCDKASKRAGSLHTSTAFSTSLASTETDATASSMGTRIELCPSRRHANMRV
jgi:glutamate mutase epsilon subunit